MPLHWRVRSTLIIILCLAACTSPAPTLSPVPTSPLILSPLDTPTALSAAVPFRLDKPIVEGINTVSGTGPSGVPIIIADVTFVGEVLGTGRIGPDGVFTIAVPVLEKGHRIGLAIGDLTGTQWKMEDFYPPEYHGDEAMQVPQVGFFHDTALVQSK